MAVFPLLAHPPHILAINNDQCVLELLRDLLVEEGYRVSIRTYIERDLDGIKRLAPDLIVLDYMWATEDASWSLLQMLRMDRQTAEIPVVLCTGAAREVAALQGQLEKMDIRVVLKPFNIDRLVETIVRALAADRSPAAG